MRGERGDVLAAPENLSPLQAGIPEDGEEQRRLADAVSSKDGEAAVLRQLERDIVEHDRVAVARAHMRVGADLLRSALREDAAAHHDDDAAREAEHDVHVVLDEEDSEIL